MTVADRLTEAIAEGLIVEGERVPSTTGIATTYQINPATVLKGMNLLAGRGLEKWRGLGMFATDGAGRRIRDQRRKELLAGRFQDLVEEAKALGVSRKNRAAIMETVCQRVWFPNGQHMLWSEGPG